LRLRWWRSWLQSKQREGDRTTFWLVLGKELNCATFDKIPATSRNMFASSGMIRAVAKNWIQACISFHCTASVDRLR
jgi:hypothetical protein